ncbi:MAG: hypothetical protein MUE98_00300 [Rhodobacteraceae bacterium]|jgi:hypothetical protein|nr:hypothetical protein [Paracoccaceae bacterium]
MPLSLYHRTLIRIFGLDRVPAALREEHEANERRERFAQRLSALAAARLSRDAEEQQHRETLAGLRAQIADALGAAPVISGLRWVEDLIGPRIAEEPDAVLAFCAKLERAAMTIKAERAVREGRQ